MKGIVIHMPQFIRRNDGPMLSAQEKIDREMTVCPVCKSASPFWALAEGEGKYSGKILYRCCQCGAMFADSAAPSDEPTVQEQPAVNEVSEASASSPLPDAEPSVTVENQPSPYYFNAPPEPQPAVMQPQYYAAPTYVQPVKRPAPIGASVAAFIISICAAVPVTVSTIVGAFSGNAYSAFFTSYALTFIMSIPVIPLGIIGLVKCIRGRRNIGIILAAIALAIVLLAAFVSPFIVALSGSGFIEGMSV